MPGGGDAGDRKRPSGAGKTVIPPLLLSSPRSRDDAVPHIIESDRSPAAYRKSWARLIQKIYEVEPLTCPKCRGTMRIISSIEDPSVIRDILNHLGLWLVRARPPPLAYTPPLTYPTVDSSHSPAPSDFFYADPNYSLVPFRVWDAYIHA